ncbi:hypothetical protein AC579_2488 [Pseudocercospora musae]|uniref:Protein CFT1 n=1 Tax=Pseudocercospora musae TaxID=113226 RepID=A0A139IEQ5_9PEZI|nr:hypothetical protein AC579_2488 [Pseudocercospora musae]
MQCYSELLPPTAVTHALSCSLLSADSKNLIVAKTSLLQVFNVHQKLSLVGEYPLAGTVTSLARIKPLDSVTGGDAIIIAFKDAKLSLVEWDPENHRISTISLHYYEGDNVITPPFGPTLAESETILTVDPSSRCAALKFGPRQLAILPFRQFGDELAGEEEEEEDDDDDDDGLENEPRSAVNKRRESTHLNGEEERTPYKASFVLPLTALDPSLSHTVHLAFLHEYREPTFGILSAPIEPSNALLEERKDLLTYTVYTLDLEQRASTNLITVPKLPSTLWKVIPLPLPIGGALLIGTNELVHVDQSGKANATAVNEFAKLESDFGMSDQSHLNLKLEDCSIETVDPSSGQLLLVTSDGALATIEFKLLGRSISSINVTPVTEDNGVTSLGAAPSCIANLAGGSVFVGSEDGASLLLGWFQPTVPHGRKRSHAQMLGKDGDEEDEDAIEEDDDDLYHPAPQAKKRAVSDTELGASNAAYRFEIRDHLQSLGPIHRTCLGRQGKSRHKLQLAAATGRKQSSRLTLLNRDVVPAQGHASRFENAKSAWAVRAHQAGDDSTLDNKLFVFEGVNTNAYEISSGDEPFVEDRYPEHAKSEWESEGETLDVAALADGKIIVQFRKQEVRTYDAKLAMNQILPMEDEAENELNIVHVSVCDAYVLVIRDDSSVQILSVQGNELEPLDVEGSMAEKKWLTGSIYVGALTQGTAAAFLLNADGALHVFGLPDLQPLFAVPTLPHLPPVVAADATQRRVGTKETLTEVLVSDLGQDGLTQPYLVLRTAMDDVVLYEPFHYPQTSGQKSWHRDLRFRKVPVSYIPKYNESIAEAQSARPPPLRSIDVGNYKAIAIPGAPPCLLLKEPSTLPRVLEIRQDAESNRLSMICPINRVGCETGFFTINTDEELEEQQLPRDTWYGAGWSVHQVTIGSSEQVEDVRRIAYHEERGLYVVATCRDVDFYFAEEDGRHPEQDDITLRPKVPQYSVHLISATSNHVIDTLHMPYLAAVTDLQVIMLEVSENTHDRKPLVVVSTAAQRGEDMPAKGTLYVYDIIDVVPDPDILESGVKLHQLARAENRGAITALAGPFPGGFIGTAQGLKMMIRGMKEDGSCLPVAFLDAQSYTHVLKTLPGRGMWLAGDAWKGLWFGGFTEEPYRVTVLGKAPKMHMEVMSAEFLPFDGALYIVVLDADCDMHVLQYDPENPKSLNGMRLLHRSTFHIGHFTTNSMLLPSTSASLAAQQQEMMNGDYKDDAKPDPLQHVLTASTSGAIGLITPLDEQAYRRLSALQTHLTSVLEHAAGLNPRAYRSIESESFGGARGVVDGSLVRRIHELGAARRADVLGRAGVSAWGLRSDLEIIGGGGLEYL